MTRFSRFVLCLFAMIGVSTSVAADVVYLKDGSVLYGRVVSQNDEAVDFNQRVGSSDFQVVNYRPRTIRKTEIVSVVVNVREDRLAELSPENPKAYRELAEELATQQIDPEAHELAIRLFLLAARYGDADLKEGSFSAVIQLARSPLEKKRFCALAFSQSDRPSSWLDKIVESGEPESGAPDSTNAGSSDQLPEQWRNRLLTALVQLRQGKRNVASKQLAEEWTKSALSPYKSICTREQLRSWTAASELKTEWLAKLLELEIAIGNAEWIAINQQPSADWSILSGRPASTVRLVNFSNVCEFDLNQNVYRGGKWVSEK